MTTSVEHSPAAANGVRGIFRVIAVCFVLSGATGLIYEVLWVRMLGLVFGATTVAISAVLAAFMGGLAVGSALGGRIAPKLQRPLRAYAVIEFVIGLYALVVPLLFRGLDQVYAGVWQKLQPGFYGFALSRFLLASLVLLVPTALMGATLPILVAALRGLAEAKSNSVARLYGFNLAGAIVGAVTAGFILLPALGVSKTIWIAALANLSIGVLAFTVGGRAPQPALSDAEPALVDKSRTRRGFWLVCAFISGVVTIGMQVVWSRVLSMIIGSSNYAFTIVLALFLIGLALGAWIVSRRAMIEIARLRLMLAWVQLITAAMLFLSLRFTSSVPSLLINIGFKFGVNSWAGLLALQILAATMLVLAPAVLMGMTMPLVLTWAGRSGSDSRALSARLVGQAYAINTLGAITGSIVTAFFLVPVTSTRFAVFCMAALCVAIAGIAYMPRGAKDPALARSLSVGGALAAIIAMLMVWPLLNLNALSAGAYDSFVRVLAKSRGGVPENELTGKPEEHRLLSYQEGRTATVSVRRDWGITSIAINGRTNASDTEDMPTQIMLGELAMLVAPKFDDVLMIGFATGVTAGSVLQSPVTSVECVEIEPAAIASSQYFEHVNNHPLRDPRLRMIVDDARTYLRVNPKTYDAIISEPSHPWVPGVANLFTREFFTLGRQRLRPNGIFVQWFQTYQLSTGNLRTVLATFHEVFPHVAVFRVQGAAKGKDLILVGSAAPVTLDYIAERINRPQVRADLDRIGLKTAEDVKAWFVCDENRLAPAIRGAVINTDDNMQVETLAPREAFRPSVEANANWIEKLKSGEN